MKKPWETLRPSLGPTKEAMGYFDLLWDLNSISMYACIADLPCLCSVVSPDLSEARLVRGSVRASPASEPYTTWLHCTGPYAVVRYTYT